MDSAMNHKKMDDFSNDARAARDKVRDTVKDTADKAIRAVKDINPEDVRKTATDIGLRVRDTSAQVVDSTVGFARENPVRAALGIFAVGFFAGAVVSMLRKSA